MEQQELYRELLRLEQQIHTLSELLGIEEVELSDLQKDDVEKTLTIASNGQGGGLLGFLRQLTNLLEELLGSIIGS